MGLSRASRIRKLASSFLPGLEGRITLEIFFSGISSSSVVLPKPSGIFFIFVVMFVPMFSILILKFLILEL